MNKSDKLNTFFTINRIISQADDWKPALDDIIYLILPILHFDCLFLHRIDESSPATTQIVYARYSNENELLDSQFNWEETLANLTIQTRKTILQQRSDDIEQHVQNSPCFLGVPLFSHSVCNSMLSWIRTGNAPFSADDIYTAEFIAQQITLLLEVTYLRQEQLRLNYQRDQTVQQEDFFSNITHELRNPLGCIKGFTTTLLRQDIQWERDKQLEFLEIINQETDRLQELIDNLLDSARIQSGQFDLQLEPLDIVQLVENVIKKRKLSITDKNIELCVDQSIPQIFGDGRRLTQVIENIINNSVKHAAMSDIKIHIDQTGSDSISIQCIDQGPGIPNEYVPQIFERFYRVPQQTQTEQGSGLGLYICKQIIEAHGGSIDLSSVAGSGTTVTIILPVSIDESLRQETES